MVNKPKRSEKNTSASKFFSSIVLTGTMLVFLLKPGISKGNETIKIEIQKILNKYPAKERKVQEATTTNTNSAEFTTSNGNIQDPYNQIKAYVEARDIEYFNKLQAFEKAKDSVDQIKNKAVIYAVLQDKDLTIEQKKVMTLALFEKFTRMPGSDLRFIKKNSALASNNPIYSEKYQKFIAYKSYLD